MCACASQQKMKGLVMLEVVSILPKKPVGTLLNGVTLALMQILPAAAFLISETHTAASEY